MSPAFSIDLTRTDIWLGIFLIVYLVAFTYVMVRLNRWVDRDVDGNDLDLGDVYVLRWNERNHDAYPSDIVDAARHVVSRNEVSEVYIQIKLKEKK